MKRMVFVDFFRAIAILLVTLFHVWKTYGKPSIIFHSFNLLGFIKHGDVGVELFFFISGFCMANSWIKSSTISISKKYFDYFLNRMFRIIPAYYCAIIFWDIFSSLKLCHIPHSFKDNIMHLFFLHTLSPKTFFSISGVLWSLGVEVQFYLVLPLIIPFLIKKTKTTLAIALIITTVSNLFWTNYFTSEFRYVITCSVLSFLFLFLSGSYCFINFSYIEKYLSKIFMRFIITIITFTLLFYDQTLIHGGKFQQIITGFFLGLTMISWSSTISKINISILKPFIFIGLSSYSIYLYNYIYYIWKFPIHGIIGYIINVTWVIMFGSLMYFLIEAPIERRRKIILNSLKTINSPFKYLFAKFGKRL